MRTIHKQKGRINPSLQVTQFVHGLSQRGTRLIPLPSAPQQLRQLIAHHRSTGIKGENRKHAARFTAFRQQTHPVRPTHVHR